MRDAPPDRLRTRVHPFFEALFSRDPLGRTWLPALLSAVPHAGSSLDELTDDPGFLQLALSLRTLSGGLACFEQPVAPPRELLKWFIDHPDRLVWPESANLTPEAGRLLRALLEDDPPGSQAKAQEVARGQVDERPRITPQWWRFEAIFIPDCVLMTDRLVVTVVGRRREAMAPASDWYPKRSELVRGIEAAKQLADGRRWASLLLSDHPLPEGSDEYLERTLPEAAPHLDAAGRAELHRAYLGNLGWRAACRATGLSPDLLSSVAPEPG